MKTPLPGASVNRRTALLTLAGSALQLAGCGGGGGIDVAGLSSGGTGSFTSGTIVGLGSIIVNGIRYDDSQATINGMRYEQSGNPLKLGMIVTVQGSATQASSTAGGPLRATASTIRYDSEWRGPISSVNTGSGTFKLLGQTVDVLAATVFDGVADLAGLAALTGPTLVEVYGYLDPGTGRLQATRIERKTSLGDYRLSGMVQQKDAGSFTLGMSTAITTIAYGARTPQPASWGAGTPVNVRMDSSSRALEITTPAQQTLGGLKLDDDEAELEGIVSAHATSSARFSVNGIEIDASGIADLASLGISQGMLVEIEGRITGDRIVASRIQVKGSPAALKTQETEYEFHGTLSQLDPVNHSFILRGYNITYDPATLKLDFQLRNELPVEVKAILSGGGLQAVEIALED